MPYCPKTNTLFIHIPKAAGSSIGKSLGIFGKDNTEGNKTVCDDIVFGAGMQHYTVTELINHLSSRGVDYDLNRSFTVLRDPIDRFISHYRWTPKGLKSGRTIEQFFTEVFLPTLGDTDVEARHRWPQIVFVTDLRDQIVVRYLINFRYLAEGYRWVLEQLEIQPVSDLPHHKRSNPTGSAQKPTELPAYIRDFLKAFYAEDVRLLDKFTEGQQVKVMEGITGARIYGVEQLPQRVRDSAIMAAERVAEDHASRRPFAYGLACLYYKSGKIGTALEVLAAQPQGSLTPRARNFRRLLSFVAWSGADRFTVVDEAVRRFIRKV